MISLPILEKINGVILYKGPSLINKKPIVCIAVNLNIPSDNIKTGNFIQTYILSDNNKTPTQNISSGDDEAVCGNCIHRKTNGFQTCYVNAAQGPSSIYGAFKRNKYPIFQENHLNLFKNRLLRLGAYGDPCSCSTDLWAKLCKISNGWTGYTHGWKYCDQNLRKYCMASVDNQKELEQAKKMGWKTFRVRRKDEVLSNGEFACPASQEQNKRLKCENCLACCGGEFNGKTKTPSIISHGLSWKSNRFNKLSKLREHKKKSRGLFNLAI